MDRFRISTAPAVNGKPVRPFTLFINMELMALFLPSILSSVPLFHHHFLDNFANIHKRVLTKNRTQFAFLEKLMVYLFPYGFRVPGRLHFSNRSSNVFQFLGVVSTCV